MFEFCCGHEILRYRDQPGRCALPRFIAVLVAMYFSVFVSTLVFGQETQLVKGPSWSIPSSREIRARIETWARQASLTDERRAAVASYLHSTEDVEIENGRLDFVVNAILLALPQFEQIGLLTRTSAEELDPQFKSLISLASNDSFVRQHLDLLVTRWLIRQRLYDEAVEHSADVEIADVLDPMSLLFSRAVAYHQLMNKRECVRACRQLLEHKDNLPNRVVSLAQMMLADIEPLEEESLDEIARMMNDIHRRQSLYRSGKVVRQQEEEVLKKLDRLIEKAEEARKQMAQQQSGGAPSTPMQDSQSAPGLGTGEVLKRNLGDGGQWGNLPPAERAAALAELTKEMPPHYRTVIEEYFRRLAQEGK